MAAASSAGRGRRTYRTALVTGASSGIGECIARELARRGCAVTLVARRADRLAALADELRSSGPVDWLAADLADAGGLELVVARLVDNPVELLVNNAGISSVGPFHELPTAREVSMVAVNAVAPHRLTRAALPGMVAAGHGGILNVSSLAGDQPFAGLATYAATKAFLTMFSESLAFELRGSGVHVTVVKPGYVFTPMNEDSSPDPASLMGRYVWSRPEQVAAAAVDAVEAGRLHCVPGAAWKAGSAMLQSLPRAAVRMIAARVRVT